MGVTRIGAALALTAMMVPVASQAAMTAIGTVSGGTNVLVARDGKVIPAAAGTPLYAGDRVITRAGGNANVQMANSCSMTVGASSMLPVSATSCAKPAAVSFDQGRAGYDGRSSALLPGGSGAWVLGAFLLAFGGTLYYILHHAHHNNNTPTSP